jgi:hypothetical protein
MTPELRNVLAALYLYLLHETPEDRALLVTALEKALGSNDQTAIRKGVMRYLGLDTEDK